MTNGEFLRPGEVEFAQFTAVLIADTLDAIIAAQLGQEEKVRELQEMAGLDVAQFAEETITEEDVEIELARLFSSPERAHSVMPGSQYIPSAPGREEVPPVLSTTGYTMTEADWQRTDQGYVFTEVGYRHILSHVRMGLAAKQLENVLQLVRRGIPRVVVDHGRINTKLTFHLSQVQKGESTETANIRGFKGPGTAYLMRSSAPLMRISRSPAPFKLTVKPADLRRPELLRLSVNLVGEVEITFKTVSD